MFRQLTVLIFALHFSCSLITDYQKVKNDFINQENKLNLSQIETLKPDGVFRDKCLRNGSAEAKSVIIQAYGVKDELKYCINDLFNFTVLMKELNESKVGELNMVYDKYCNRIPNIKQCFTDFFTILDPCLNEGLLESRKNIERVVDTIVELLCKQEADRIGMFLQDGGPECIRDQSDSILRCYQTTLECHLPKFSTLDIFTVLVFSIGEKQCSGLKAFRGCTVSKLARCEEISAADQVNTILGALLEATPCSSTIKPSASDSSEAQGFIEFYWSAILLDIDAIILEWDRKKDKVLLCDAIVFDEVMVIGNGTAGNSDGQPFVSESSTARIIITPVKPTNKIDMKIVVIPFILVLICYCACQCTTWLRKLKKML